MAYNAPNVQSPSSTVSPAHVVAARKTPIAAEAGTNPKLVPKGKSKGKSKKKGGVPNIKGFLAGDDVFQNTKSDLKQNFGLAREATRTNTRNVNEDYNLLVARMRKQQEKDQGRLADDYAARGLLGSGLSVKADEDLNTGYSEQFTDALTSKNRNLGQLTMDLNSARSLMKQQRQDARLNAIRRRAERYGIT